MQAVAKAAKAVGMGMKHDPEGNSMAQSLTP